MNMFSIIGWLRCNQAFQVRTRTVRVSRGLLLVIALELITMPVTQDLWAWDKFLHGGQDFELGMLVIVACLCLALLHAEQSKRDLGFMVAIRALLLKKRPLNLARSVGSLRRYEYRSEIPASPRSRLMLLPLLI